MASSSAFAPVPDLPVEGLSKAALIDLITAAEHTKSAAAATQARATIARRRLQVVTPPGHTYTTTSPTLPGTGGDTPTETLRHLIEKRRPFTIIPGDGPAEVG